MSYHVGMYFSTKDLDNDGSRPRDCSKLEGGGWWYNDCSMANLNGLYLYGDISGRPEMCMGLSWATWKGHAYSLEVVKMMIREHGKDYI